jgi:hypothetical protein
MGFTLWRPEKIGKSFGRFIGPLFQDFDRCGHKGEDLPVALNADLTGFYTRPKVML